MTRRPVDVQEAIDLLSLRQYELIAALQSLSGFVLGYMTNPTPRDPHDLAAQLEAYACLAGERRAAIDPEAGSAPNDYLMAAAASLREAFSDEKPSPFSVIDGGRPDDRA